MGKIRYNISRPLVKTAFIVVLSLLVVFLIAVFRGINLIISYCDAFFVGGAVLLCLGLLSFVTFYGVFDIFGYSTSYVFNGMKKGSVQRYKDFHDYIEQKTEKRKKNKYNFLPYVSIGLIYIIIAAILMLFL